MCVVINFPFIVNTNASEQCTDRLRKIKKIGGNMVTYFIYCFLFLSKGNRKKVIIKEINEDAKIYIFFTSKSVCHRLTATSCYQ